MGISRNGGTPKWLVYHGHSHKKDDLGVPTFKEPLTCFFYSVTDMCRPQPSPIGLPDLRNGVAIVLSISDYDSHGSSEPNSSPQSAASSAPAMISSWWTVRFSCAILRLLESSRRESTGVHNHADAIARPSTAVHCRLFGFSCRSATVVLPATSTCRTGGR